MSKDNIPAPLATLELGKTYIFNLKNVTQTTIQFIYTPPSLFWSLMVSASLNRSTLILCYLENGAKAAFVADNPVVGCTTVMLLSI